MFNHQVFCIPSIFFYLCCLFCFFHIFRLFRLFRLLYSPFSPSFFPLLPHIIPLLYLDLPFLPLLPSSSSIVSSFSIFSSCTIFIFATFLVFFVFSIYSGCIIGNDLLSSYKTCYANPIFLSLFLGQANDRKSSRNKFLYTAIPFTDQHLVQSFALFQLVEEQELFKSFICYVFYSSNVRHNFA